MIAFGLQFYAGSLFRLSWESKRVGLGAVSISGLAVVVMVMGEVFALLSLSFDQNVGILLVKLAMVVAVVILFSGTLNAVYTGQRAIRNAEQATIDEESSPDEAENH